MTERPEPIEPAPAQDTAARGHEVPLLEYDETVPPRPEEEVADAGRDGG